MAGNLPPKRETFEAAWVVLRKAGIDSALVDALETPLPALVDLSLDKAPQGSTPEHFVLLASLSFGVSRVEEGDFKAGVWLKQAQLVFDPVVCHAKVNSKYGQEPKRDGIVDPPVGNRSRFIGPRHKDDDVLYGEPPGLEVLAEMENEGPRLPRVTVSVQCDRDTDLAVLIRRPGPAGGYQAVPAEMPSRGRWRYGSRLGNADLGA